jgi:hypothetical protein
MRELISMLSVFVWVTLLGASPTPGSLHLEGTGTALFGPAWNPALGAWLPSFGDLGEPWRSGAATEIAQRDGFVYAKPDQDRPNTLGLQGPGDGTAFVYGKAGPVRGHVVYDPAHHVAFYEQGCCSYFDVAASADVVPPPKPVVTHDLSGLTTVRGIRLGETPTAVMQIYGRSRLLSVTGHAGLQMLAYTTWKPFKSMTTVTPCGQFQNFVFRQERLIYIGFGNGC